MQRNKLNKCIIVIILPPKSWILQLDPQYGPWATTNVQKVSVLQLLELLLEEHELFLPKASVKALVARFMGLAAVLSG